jgi:sulfur transfer protein SufE
VEPELLAPIGNEESGVQKLQQLVEEVAKAGDGRARVRRVLDHATKMPRLPAKAKVAENRVMGCTSQVVADLLWKQCRM